MVSIFYGFLIRLPNFLIGIISPNFLIGIIVFLMYSMYSFCILYWIARDSENRNEHVSMVHAVIILFISPFAYVVYCFKSRGLQKGFVCLFEGILALILVFGVLLGQMTGPFH